MVATVLERDGYITSPSMGPNLGARSVGVLDYDGDGLLDLFITDDHWSGGSSALFRNTGDLEFTDVTETAGIPRDVAELGVSVADLNGAGSPDLLVAGMQDTPPRNGGVVPAARMLINNRTGWFNEFDASTFDWLTHGSDDDAAGIVAADLNRDGRRDIVIGAHYNSVY